MLKLDLQAKIFIAGGRGMVGSAVVSRLRDLGFKNILLPHREELDLSRQDSVEKWFRVHVMKKIIYFFDGGNGSTTPLP